MIIYTEHYITDFVHLLDDPRISSITYPGVRTLLSQQGTLLELWRKNWGKSQTRGCGRGSKEPLIASRMKPITPII